MAARLTLLLAVACLLPACKEQFAKVTGQINGSAKEAKSVKPGKGERVCFECAGTGRVRCGAGGCQSGQKECPSACLKLSRGKWEHMEVEGHSPDEWWQKFPKAEGGYQAWNHHHAGEVIQTIAGVPRNVGKCQTCMGTTKVQCPTCLGKGDQICFICEGKAVVPAAWTSADNPRLNNNPDLIRLRDGRKIIGRIAMQGGAFTTIRTRDGKTIEVNSAEILPKEVPQ